VGLKMKKFQIFVPLPDVRPDWLRKIICVIYFPLVTPIIAFLFLVFLMIRKLEYSAKEVLKAIWYSFYVSCWIGVDIDYMEYHNKYSK
jgi:ABC-type transport system involved in cytochrome c biogenesis permease subunit